ncbi:hypothetical protein E1286_00055 [Nonomuraea terrae]|uniref:DUF5979 domain-containing protein n=1 Tax=Nonomuraea terrae TaxID=2530383 RepID=A0A4R4ZK83_9ACTN|nr:DUF5979 domain-containing protein [Nonomuraea terrae]TDD57162.1 hypothetical protein E1286_00055 [Nonomuraea terrae]
MAIPATGGIAGPFTVTGDGPRTLRLEGVEVFTDPNGANQLQEGAQVAPGTRLWARSVSGESPQGFVIERTVTVLVGTVLLYDRSNPSLADAQKLVRYRVPMRASAPVGSRRTMVTGIPAGSECTITEPVTGDNDHVDLVSPPVISPATIIVTANQTQQVSITNTYRPACGPGHKHPHACGTTPAR